MLQKLFNLLLNWLVAYIVIPVSMVVVDYFQLRKTNKELKAKVEALEKAQTVQEKIDAANNIP